MIEKDEASAPVGISGDVESAVKRVESVEFTIMNMLHEFGEDWSVSSTDLLGPLERRGLKRNYARRFFDLVFDYIENKTRLTTNESSPESETGDQMPTVS